MKFKVQNQEQSFNPISFTVTCEDQLELDFWASLLNHSSIHESFENFTNAKLSTEYSTELDAVGGDEHKTNLLGLSFEKP